jgi:hypothetical protein
MLYLPVAELPPGSVLVGEHQVSVYDIAAGEERWLSMQRGDPHSKVALRFSLSKVGRITLQVDGGARVYHYAIGMSIQ